MFIHTAAASPMVANAAARSDVLAEVLRIADGYAAAARIAETGSEPYREAVAALTVAVLMWDQRAATQLEGVLWQLRHSIEQLARLSWSWRTESTGVVDGGTAILRADENARAAELVAEALRAIETRFATVAH
ncbi:hypothetical protein [Nocardia salmonicida]|uniref:hypothetical protein n=1 Tax=Nocardia salmonicida TaxID=53431 RepID=UPI003788886E